MDHPQVGHQQNRIQILKNTEGNMDTDTPWKWPFITPIEYSGNHYDLLVLPFHPLFHKGTIEVTVSSLMASVGFP